MDKQEIEISEQTIKDFDNLVIAINACGIALAEIVIPAMEGLFEEIEPTINELVKIPREYDALRNEDETIIEGGNRLQSEGYLDNPDIRWEYQKTVWLWLPRKLGLFKDD